MCFNAWFQFNSSYYEYVTNIIDEKNLSEYMKTLFYTAPKKCIFVECYHYYYTGTGKNRTRKKRVTFSSNFFFQYLFWRDVSGTFDFNKQGKQDFCRFRIDYKIDLHDAETSQAYNMFRNNLQNQYRNFDEYFTFTEIDQLDNIKVYNLVALNNERSFAISKEMYILFFCVLLVDLYKLFILLVTSFESFNLTKTISITEDLRQMDKFESFVPSLIFRTKSVVFDAPPSYSENDWIDLTVPNQNEVETSQNSIWVKGERQEENTNKGEFTGYTVKNEDLKGKNTLDEKNEQLLDNQAKKILTLHDFLNMNKKLNSFNEKEKQEMQSLEGKDMKEIIIDDKQEMAKTKNSNGAFLKRQFSNDI